MNLKSLTRQQRLILGGALLFNVVVLGVLAWLILSTPNTVEPLPQVNEPNNTVECENNVALSLRQTGISASVTISHLESVQVYVDGADASAAWSVLNVMPTLKNFACGPYSIIRIDVPDPEQRPHLRLVLEATWADMLAWTNGSINDGQMSDRMKRRSYEMP